MTRRRVVITGLGTVNPLGSNVTTTWKALCAGRSGIGPIQQFDTSAFKVRFGGEVRDFNPEPAIDSRAARRMDRYSQFAILAAIGAVSDSGLDLSREDLYRCGVILGSGIGGRLSFLERQVDHLLLSALLAVVGLRID